MAYLDVVALVVVAAFAEQAMVDHAVDVELVEQRVAVFGDGCGEYHDLVELADSFHELVDAGAFDDIDVVELPLDLNRYGEVGLVQNLSQLRN